MYAEFGHLRSQGKAARRCKHGYEYGYWAVDDTDDSRYFLRVGIARTMDAALRRLESL